jgi:hypothetical protein
MKKIKQFEPHIPYTEEDYKRFQQMEEDYKIHCDWIKNQNFQKGDFVIFEGEKCEILDIFDFDCCVLKHKNHTEEHLLKYCEKINFC